MINLGALKITIDAPENELADAMRFTGAATKRDAVAAALREFNRRQRLAALIEHFGASETFMTHAELMKRHRSAMTA
jgi:Arc/MetJ family transcription regulator